MKLYHVIPLIVLLTASGMRGQTEVQINGVTYDRNSLTLTLTFMVPVTDAVALACADYDGFVVQDMLMNPTVLNQLTIGPMATCTQSMGQTMYTIEIYPGDAGYFDSGDTLYLAWDANLFVTGETYTTTAGVLLVTLVPDTTPPNAESFSLDLNTGVLTITFDSPISTATANVEDLSFSNDEGGTVTMTLSTWTLPDDDITNVISLTLPSEQQGSLASSGICETTVNCYISISSEFISDAAGNDVVATPMGMPLLVTDFIADTTPPELLGFEVNFVEGSSSFTLTFSEIVNSATTLDVTQITFTSAVGSSDNIHTLTAGTVANAVLNTIEVTFAADDLTALTTERICQSLETCFIYFPTTLVQDYNGNPVVPIPLESAQAASVITDTVSPSLQSFSLDLNTGVLTLTFDTLVDISNINVDVLSFSDTTETLMLPTTLISTISDSTVNLQLSTGYQGSFGSSGVCTDGTSCYIFFSSDFISDLFGNPVVAVESATPLQAQVFTQDATSPILVEFDVTFAEDSSFFTLTFDEAVRANTLMATAITFSDAATLPDNTRMLTGGTPVADDVLNTIDITFSDNDLTGLTGAQICQTLATCFISVTAEMVEDYSSNQVAPVPATNALQASAVSDTIPPSVESFSLDLNTGELSLTFDSVVSTSTADPGAFSFSDGGTETKTLPWTSSDPDNNIISLALSSGQQGSLASSGICVSAETCFIFFSSMFISDPSGNAVVAIPTDMALQASGLTPDTTPPELLRFEVNYAVDGSSFTLTFSETVNSATLDLTQITFTSGVGSSDSTYTLTGGTMGVEDNTIDISFSDDDLTALTEAQICQTVETCFIYFTSSMVQDYSGNFVVPILLESAQLASAVTDTIPPSLQSFSLDLNTGVLTLTFDSIVHTSTASTDDLSFSDGGDTQTLAELPWTLSDTDSDIISLTIPSEQQGSLASSGICLSVETCFIFFSSEFISDLFGNRVVAIAMDMPLQASELAADTTPPELLGFEVNLDSSSFTLTFSEIVDSNDLLLTAITFTSAGGGSGNTYPLTGGDVGVDLNTIDITFNPTDLTGLTTAQICQSPDTCFIYFTDALVEDYSNLNIVPIPLESALRASMVTDTIPPSVNSFSLDLDNGEVVLNFDSLVDIPNINVNALSFSDGTTETLMLPTTLISTTSDSTVNLQLSPGYQGSFGRSGVCTTMDTCYIFFSSDFISDLFGNPVVAIESATPLQAQTFTPDTTSPVLVEFDVTFAEGSSFFTLTFDEAVRADTLTTTTITFSSVPDNTLPLTGGTPVDTMNTVDITFIDGDLTDLTTMLICQTPETCFISFTADNIVTDYSGNVAVPLGGTLQASAIIDTIPPTVQSFSLDLNTGELTLNFGSTVDISTANPEALSFSDGDTKSLMLPWTASSDNPFTTAATISISPQYLGSLAQSGVCTNEMSCSIFFTQDFISDPVGNPVVPVLSESALQVDMFAPDTTRPTITSFEVNLGRNFFTLTFSEIVDSSMLQYDAITLSDSAAGTNTLDLTGGTVMNEVFNVVDIGFSDADLTNLGAGPVKCETVDTCFISFTENFAQDYSGNLVEPANAVQASEPENVGVTKVTYDSNALAITLTFSEPVNFEAVACDDYNGLVLQNTVADPTIRYELTSDDIISCSLSLDQRSVTFYHNYYDIFGVAGLFNSVDTSAVAWDENLLLSTSTYSISAGVMAVTTFIEDTTPPNVVSFSLDLDDGVLTLTFDSPISTSTTNTESLSFSNGGTATLMLPWTLPTPPDAAYTNVVSLSHPFEYQGSLARADICEDTSSCFISFSGSLISDPSGNPVVSIEPESAFQVANLLPDSTQPQLRAFEVDLGEGSLTLNFSEAVSRTNLDFSAITFANAGDSATNILILSGGAIANDILNTVDIYLTRSDLITLAERQICLTLETCYITTADNLGQDYSGNTVVAVPPEEALQATSITDTVGPSVESFSLDLNTGELTLTFDSAVDIDTAIPDALSFSDGDTQTLALPGAMASGVLYSSIVILTLPSQYQGSFGRSGICRSLVTCFIFYSNELITDPFGNSVVPILPTTALQVQDFTQDATSPELVEFEVNIGRGAVTLTFTEAVIGDTLDSTAITFTSAVETSASRLTLTGGMLTDEAFNTIAFEFPATDLAALTAAQICQTVETCFISITSNLVQDYNQNPVSAIAVEGALQASIITGDDGDISVLSVGFDHNEPSLLLTFSEPVDLGAINCRQTEFTYLNHLDFPSASVTPKYPGVCNQSGPSEIVFWLDTRDYITILTAGDLWSSSSNSFLRWSDQLGLTVNITAGEKMADFIIRDISAPMATGFNLDLERGYLTLFFDSIIGPSSLDPALLSFHDVDRTTVYRLTGGSWSFDGGTTICLMLSATDLIQLRSLPACADVKSCYLSLGMGAIQDYFANVAVPTTLQVGRLHRDGIEGLLRVDLQYFGCSGDIILFHNEPLVLQTDLEETAVSVQCGTGELTWKPGTLEDVTSPLQSGSSVLRVEFPNGLGSQNFGVYVCTSQDGYTENFIVNYHPFVGSPDNSVAVGFFYSSLSYLIHYWPKIFDTGYAVSTNDAVEPRIGVSFEGLHALVTVDATDVVYSLAGDYVAVLEDTTGNTTVTLPFTIVIQDPTVEASVAEVVIRRDQTQQVFTCTPSSSALPLVWRDGQTRLAETTAGVSLSPEDLHHQLALDLTTYSLSGNNIVCEILNPEDASQVIASDNIQVILEGVVQCEAEEDSALGIQWDSTYEGGTDEQSCPQNNEQEVTGVARRRCLEGGVWGEVDLSNCENKVLSDLRAQVEECLLEKDPSGRTFSQALAILEEFLRPDQTAFVFPQDFITANVIVEDVLLCLTDDVVQGTGIFQTNVLGVLDTMLSEDHEEDWEDASSVDSQSDTSLLLQNCESYGQYMTQAILSDSVDTGDSVILAGENIEISAQKLDRADHSDVVYPEDGEEGSDRAQIVIPAAYLSSRDASAVVNMRILNIEQFLPEDDEGIPAAQVISSQVVANRDPSDAVTVQLIFTTTPMKNAKNPRCVYWSLTERRWLTEGITAIDIEDMGSYSYKVRCESSHLTPFSVLVDIIEEEERFELTGAGYVGAGVLTGCALLSSILFTVSLFFCCCGSRQFNSTHVVHLAHLCFSLCILCIGVLFLAGLIEAREDTVACSLVAALLQYFFAAAFTWTLAITFMVLLVVAPTRPIVLSQKQFLALLLLFGLVLPLVPTAISAGVLSDDYGNFAFCWVGDSGAALWANVAPMIAIALVALLLIVPALFYARRKESWEREFQLSGVLIIEAFTALLTVLVGGPLAFGLVMVNSVWDPAEWLFLVSSIALGLVIVAESLLLVFWRKKCDIIAADDGASNKKKKTNKNFSYWRDEQPLVKESRIPLGYPVKGVTGVDSAYVMMGAPATEEDIEAMMEENPYHETELQDETSSTNAT